MMMSKEFIWLVAHPEIDAQYPGEYIAIVGDAVVAHGEDFAKVLLEAEKHGDSPLLHKAQRVDRELVV
ncbi:MAG TPA: DUF5678 domain-containing protein [Thermoanaerobaculia bacterium]|jgi:hypothetical protein